MAMGIRDGEQAPLWVVTSDLPKSPGHPFFARLNALLDANDFDRFVEKKCQSFYAKVMGRPSLTPGRYFRLLLLGYFEGIDSERGIAWRATDSLAVRSFLGLASTTRRPIIRRFLGRGARLTWRRTGRSSRGCSNGWSRPGSSRGKPSRSTPRRWKPTPRCGASCGGTRRKPIRS